MKRHIIAIATGLLLMGCSSAPSTDQATQIISGQMRLPRTVDFDLFRSDPEHARRVLDAGLERDGYISVKRTQKLSEIGQPIIFLTPKSKPFLLETPEKERKLGIQKVRLATEQISSLEVLETSGNRTIVEYSTTYDRPTPFIVLLSSKAQQPRKRKIYLIKQKAGWSIQK